MYLSCLAFRRSGPSLLASESDITIGPDSGVKVMNFKIHINSAAIASKAHRLELAE